jgi:hypothetical protein
MRVSSSGRKRLAPAVSIGQISITEASKEGAAICVARSLGFTSYTRWCQAMRLTKPRCSMGTPLGFPVDPEV